ncbi:MAG: hypothetical protein ACI8RZ_007332, partial [Myxococcota bacterium]
GLLIAVGNPSVLNASGFAEASSGTNEAES